MKRITSFLVAACMLFILQVWQGVFSADAFAAQSSAPSWSGISVDGKPISTSSLKGKVYIVNFFATWCPPCRAEVPDMVQVQKAWASKGFTFVGIAVNETLPSVKAFMASNGITYPVLMANSDVVRAYSDYIPGGITGIPTSFIIDASGNVTSVIVGPRSKSAFDQIIKTAFTSKPGR
ncbi:MAG: TlpA family protein disulfide reductase [Chlorobiaceae bacterium]|nr:TlpA family protein disulfide reductase [Chlorobiaceae bacterium]